MKKIVSLAIVVSLVWFVSLTVNAYDRDKRSILNDHVNGYSLTYPTSMQIDRSLQPIRTVLSDSDTKVEIYYDHFQGTIADSAIYMSYSNQPVVDDPHNAVEKNETGILNGMNTHILKWHREKLTKMTDDKNYYATIEIAKNSTEAYTLLIKSRFPIQNELDWLNGFKIIDKTETAQLAMHFYERPLHRNKETLQVYNHYFKSNPLKWGIFQPDAPDKFTNLMKKEDRLQYTFDVLLRYQSITHEVPKQALIQAWNHRRLVELTLQTIGRDHKANLTYDILNGKYDAYFEKYAQDLKAFGHPVLFRLNNEMNGDWVGYSAYYASKDTDLYKAVWKYVYNVFEENGVDNVIWVWNPNHESKPAFAWNHELMYYPGDDYADVIGLTAYNTGNYYTAAGEKWRTFQELYDPLYKRYVHWFDKPLMITEFASSSIGGDKAAWIADMFRVMYRYPKIKIAIWWNGIDWDGEQPARLYELDDNESVMDSFRTGLMSYDE